MNWLTRIRKSLPFRSKRETPDNLWTKCPNCSEMLFTRDYEANLSVCTRCGHHGRIGAEERLALLLDDGYQVLATPEVREDPLKFRDSKR
ncbi:MAG: acetyl-CoA carboxylase carboxyl transferase subunit beta, partial [Novosphingobium sp.]